MLTGIEEIQQDGLMEMADFAIESSSNIVTFGAAGIGKTEIFMQRAAAAGRHGIYLNLSVIEAPDLMGLMQLFEGKTRYCIPEKFRLFGEKTNRFGNDDDGDVLVVDELDKARPELQNPMLELFQYRSINGTKLNIKAVMATGNLPDENAFSQPVSHALMNRCLVYQTSAAFDPWMKWAVDSHINGLVIGFLSRNSSHLITKPPKDDITAYLHGTPRSWTNAARALDLAHGRSVEFQTRIVSGFVGIPLATQFRVWLDHSRHIQPAVDALVNHGKHPELKDSDGLERLFVFGIAGASAIMQAAQRVEGGKADPKDLKRITSNVMGWMKDVPTEYAIGALKSVLTMDVITKHELMRISPFMEKFVQIRQAWEKK
jgi:hypothetical protein